MITLTRMTANQDINAAPKGSIFLLHACAHNPTGVDPSGKPRTLNFHSDVILLKASALEQYS